MSCEAERKATPRANPAKTCAPADGPNSAIAANASAKPNCVKIIQPRRRPSQGGTSRSITGAHMNFTV